MNWMQVSHESNNKIILFVWIDATAMSNNTNNANGNEGNGWIWFKTDEIWCNIYVSMRCNIYIVIDGIIFIVIDGIIQIYYKIWWYLLQNLFIHCNIWYNMWCNMWCNILILLINTLSYARKMRILHCTISGYTNISWSGVA